MHFPKTCHQCRQAVNPCGQCFDAISKVYPLVSSQGGGGGMQGERAAPVPCTDPPADFELSLTAHFTVTKGHTVTPF